MRNPWQVCKLNHAENVKRIAPGEDWAAVWVPGFIRILSPESSISWHKKRVDNGICLVIIIFTSSRPFCSEMPMPKPPSDDPKLQTLRQQGTLNPRPQAVTDEQFVQGGFFDARDLVQVKYEMLRRVKKEGRTITTTTAAFGFSRPSFYQAQSAFEGGGLAGLMPHKRGPKEAHKLTDEILDFLQQTRQDDPALRSAELASRVVERFGVIVHPRTIERGLARRQKKRRKRE